MSVLYASDVVRQGLLSVWDEPAVANPPKRVWRDWLLVGVLVPTAVLEGLLRPDVVWRPVALVTCVALVFTLLWRRTHPLAVILTVFVVVTLIDLVAPVSSSGERFGLFTTAFVLLLPYALGRWGSGRDIVIGLAFTLGAQVLREVVNGNLGDMLIGIPFLLTPAVLGLAVRYRHSARSREVEQVKMREREQLARELHDTVAHHVSAIVIQAQAGRVLSGSRPDAALEALRVIESEASRTLREMRTMVGALRDGQAADLAPQQGIADIPSLARVVGQKPVVDVELIGELDGLPPEVGAAVYRLAQESITNAVRHARHATRIDVKVTGEESCVRLSVVDDGDMVPSARSSWGYGLVGMTERATLLGGSLEAGPGPQRGWTVTAVLPLTGAAA